MATIEIKIDNNESNFSDNNVDLICTEKVEHLKNIVGSSFVEINLVDEEKRKTLAVKFEWKEDNLLDISDLHFVPETNVLFFRSTYQWGVIDLIEKKLLRHESSLWSPFIEQKNDYVLIIDDLSAESTDLNGQRIDRVPIDPPHESKEFDNRIEFTSPVYGHQVLKVK